MILPDDKNLYAYLRRYQDDVILIVNSFSRKKQVFDFSHYELVEMIISNYGKTTIKNNQLYLKPYESIVFKVKEHI